MMNNNLIKRSTYGNRNDLKLLVNSLPEPFSCLDIKPDQSSSGKCWIFHVDLDGFMLGFLFPGGLQLYGLKIHNNMMVLFLLSVEMYKKAR